MYRATGDRVWLAGTLGALEATYGYWTRPPHLVPELGLSRYFDSGEGPAPEVGVLPVTLTAEGRADPVLSVLGDEFPALQWHGDTFDIPAGAVCLGESAAYPHQAMRFGEVARATNS